MEGNGKRDGKGWEGGRGGEEGKGKDDLHPTPFLGPEPTPRTKILATALPLTADILEHE